MNVACASCQTQYKIDASKVPDSGGFIKCKTCGGRVRIPPPSEVANTPPVPAPTPPSPFADTSAIALSGSEPDDDPTQVTGPPSSFSQTATIPLDGSADPTGAIPLGGSVAPGAIPLGGSNAPTDAIPLGGSVAPGAIPLGGSVAPGAIPLGGSVAPGAIPLGGSDGPTDAIPLDADVTDPDGQPTHAMAPGGTHAQAPAAIPLGGSDAQPPGAIPLGGSDAQPPGAIPLGGSDGTSPAVGAIPLGDSGATTVDESDVIALGDSEDVVPLSANSEPSTTDLYDDMPVPVTDDAPTVVAPSPTPEAHDAAADHVTTVATGGGPPQFLDNLPVAADTAPGPKADPDNLPMAAPDRVDPIEDLPMATTNDPLFDDLPTPDIESIATIEEPDNTAVKVESDTGQMDTFDDLPMAGMAALSLMDAPSLMDDLADSPNTTVSPFDGNAMSALSSPIDAQGSEAAPHPSDVGPIQTGEHPTVPDTGEDDKKKSSIALIAALGGVLLVALVAAVSTPYAGLQLWDPLGFSEQVEPVEPPPAEPPQAKTKTKAKEKAKAPEPPPQPEVVVLSAANVDSLGYVQLREATTAHAASDAPNRGLLAWARYRLAATFGDEQARESLLATAPKKNELAKLDGREAAAAVGALVLSGKVQPARKTGEKLQRRLKDSPHLAYVLGTTYSKRPEMNKALKLLGRAKEAGLVDAQLRSGQLLLQGRNPGAGVAALTELATSSTDVDLAVLVANTLLESGQAQTIEDIAARVTVAPSLKNVAPTRRDLAYRLFIGRDLRTGDLDAAITHASKRAALSPQNAKAAIDLARLQQANGQDGDSTLERAVGQVTDPTTAAELAAARVELALRKGDRTLAARALEEGHEALSQKGAWLKLAEGWVAKHNGQMAAAKKAFSAAARTKAKLADARLEQALVSDKGGPLLKKLTELDKKGLPAATYQLARLMRSRGNAKGASELYGRLVSTGSTVIDPIALVLEWLDTVAQAGEPALARKQIEVLRGQRPEDERLVAQLIAIAARAGDTEAVVNLHRDRVKAKPDDADRKIRLAAALNDAGDFIAAQKLLDDLFKADKKARTAPALAQLGRAWVTREPFRAKELFNESLSINENVGTYVLLGELEAGREKYDEARKAFEKALSLNPQLLGAQIQLARVAMAEGDLPEAAKRLEKVLAKDPTNYDATLSLGDAYLGLNKVVDCALQYETAATLRPDNADLLMKLALIQLQRLARTDEAISTLQKVIAVAPKRSAAYYHLGMAMKDNGNTTGAVTHLQKYLEIAPEGEWAPDAKKILDDLK